MTDKTNSYSGGLTLTVSPEGIEISTANLTEDVPGNDEGRTAAILCALLLREAAQYINDRASTVTSDDVITFIREKKEDE